MGNKDKAEIIRLKDHATHYVSLPRFMWPELPADVIDFAERKKKIGETGSLPVAVPLLALAGATFAKMLLPRGKEQTRIERAVDDGLTAFLGSMLGSLGFEEMSKQEAKDLGLEDDDG